MIHPVSGASGRAILPPMAHGPGSDLSTVEADRRPRVGVIGAGRVGSALAVAIDRAGWPVVAVSSRDAARRSRVGRLIPGAGSWTTRRPWSDLVDLVLLTVPDDVIETVAASIRLRPGQAIVHTSGALPSGILAAAQVPGTTAASFHPLVPFADLDRALAALPGATIAIEGDPALVALLSELATDWAPGRSRCRPRASLPITRRRSWPRAASWRSWMSSPSWAARSGHGRTDGTRAIYAPLIRAGLANAKSLGIAAALTGPVVRGDARTVELHLEAIDRLAPARPGPVRRPAVRPPGRPCARSRGRTLDDRPGRAAARPGRTLTAPSGSGTGNIAPMQHEVSAFHGTSARTRFVLPGNQHRGPRSGLLRVFRTPTSQAPAVRAAASRQPVRAIRAATRGAQHPSDTEHATGVRLTPVVASMRWSPPRPLGHGSKHQRNDPMARLTDQDRQRMPGARATSAGGVVLRQGERWPGAGPGSSPSG